MYFNEKMRQTQCARRRQGTQSAAAANMTSGIVKQL